MLLNKVAVYVIPESSPQLISDMHQASSTTTDSAQLSSTHFQTDLFAALHIFFDILHNSDSSTQDSAIMQ